MTLDYGNYYGKFLIMGNAGSGFRLFGAWGLCKDRPFWGLGAGHFLDCDFVFCLGGSQSAQALQTSESVDPLCGLRAKRDTL